MLIDIKNDVKEIDRVCDKVKNFCMEHSISNEKYQDIILILDEITSNIINYAYPDDKEHWFSVFLEKKEERLVIKFLDNGMAFNPLKKETPDTESSIEERQIGGLGIFIVKQLSEFIEYSRIDDKNQLEITVSVSTNFHK